ncbi:hypothetical protein CXG81DRAFT_16436 [Caulochytrium protostelioides]|uniref:GRAM domain-containing protein n=1 Tax=Caulochytrium protostelioides TaxID=1555241 RepID=A0A4P9XF19_9FUNG|nr:hypothetical protein CXG81DRAFT_16436 [Caulochytrium protostelioides]|eukprot:RKP04154.1 hypothetical protein CXG81DRAFT_16436 [Caulochytrium protostelioides]
MARASLGDADTPTAATDAHEERQAAPASKGPWARRSRSWLHRASRLTTPSRRAAASKHSAPTSPTAGATRPASARASLPNTGTPASPTAAAAAAAPALLRTSAASWATRRTSMPASAEGSPRSDTAPYALLGPAGPVATDPAVLHSPLGSGYQSLQLTPPPPSSATGSAAGILAATGSAVTSPLGIQVNDAAKTPLDPQHVIQLPLTPSSARSKPSQRSDPMGLPADGDGGGDGDGASDGLDDDPHAATSSLDPAQFLWEQEADGPMEVGDGDDPDDPDVYPTNAPPASASTLHSTIRSTSSTHHSAPSAGGTRHSLSTLVRRGTRGGGSLGGGSANGATEPPERLVLSSERRNRDAHIYFPLLPSDEVVLSDYSAAWSKEIIFHGRLYLTQNHLGFYSNIFGFINACFLHLTEITRLERRVTAKIIPNAILITTVANETFLFTSFLTREATLARIRDLCLAAHRAHGTTPPPDLLRLLPAPPTAADLASPPPPSSANGPGDESAMLQTARGALDPLGYEPYGDDDGFDDGDAVTDDGMLPLGGSAPTGPASHLMRLSQQQQGHAHTVPRTTSQRHRQRYRFRGLRTDVADPGGAVPHSAVPDLADGLTSALPYSPSTLSDSGVAFNHPPGTATPSPEPRSEEAPSRAGSSSSLTAAIGVAGRAFPTAVSGLAQSFWNACQSGTQRLRASSSASAMSAPDAAGHPDTAPLSALASVTGRMARKRSVSNADLPRLGLPAGSWSPVVHAGSAGSPLAPAAEPVGMTHRRGPAGSYPRSAPRGVPPPHLGVHSASLPRSIGRSATRSPLSPTPPDAGKSAAAAAAAKQRLQHELLQAQQQRLQLILSVGLLCVVLVLSVWSWMAWRRMAQALDAVTHAGAAPSWAVAGAFP